LQKVSSDFYNVIESYSNIATTTTTTTTTTKTTTADSLAPKSVALRRRSHVQNVDHAPAF